MATPVTLHKISSVSIGDNKTPVHIGASVKEKPTRPIRHLPARLDAKACLTLLAQTHPDWTVESLEASGKQLDIHEVDNCLEFTDLSLADRMQLKSALSQFGIISRGRRI